MPSCDTCRKLLLPLLLTVAVGCRMLDGRRQSDDGPSRLPHPHNSRTPEFNELRRFPLSAGESSKLLKLGSKKPTETSLKDQAVLPATTSSTPPEFVIQVDLKTAAGDLKSHGDEPQRIAMPAVNEAEDEGAPDALTLAQLEEYALRNNPTLRQAAAVLQRARGRWLQAGLYPNPTSGYESEEINDNGSAGRHGVFVGQRIVTANKLGWNRAVAAGRIDTATWQAETQRFRVLSDVRLLFYEALGAQQSVQLAEELLKVAQQGAKLAQQLKDAKQAPQTDVLQAEIDLEVIELLLKNARQRKQAALRQLAAVAGLRELPTATLQGELSLDQTPIDQESSLQRVLSSSPLLEAARADVRRARSQLGRESVQPVPDVNTRLGTSYDFGADRTLFGLEVGVMLPLRNRNQGNIAAAHADVHRAIENVQRLELALRRRFAAVYQQYETARAQAVAYQTTILQKAQRTLDLTVEAAKGGQVDLLRVLTARRTLFELKLQAIAAAIELQKAKAQLEGLLLTGGLSNPESFSVSGSAGRGGMPVTSPPTMPAMPPLTVTPRP